MIIIDTVNSTRFLVDGIEYFKNYISEVAGNQITIFNAYDRKDIRVDWVHYGEIELNGVVYGNSADLQSALLPVIYTRASLGGGGGGVVDFIDLADVPNTYTGQSEKVVRVKTDESGLEFIVGGSSTTPTLQEVTTEGNVSNNEIIVDKADAYQYIAKSNNIEGVKVYVSDGDNDSFVEVLSTADANTKTLYTPGGASVRDLTLGDTTNYLIDRIGVNGISYPLPNGASSQIATLADITGGVPTLQEVTTEGNITDVGIELDNSGGEIGVFGTYGTDQIGFFIDDAGGISIKVSDGAGDITSFGFGLDQFELSHPDFTLTTPTDKTGSQTFAMLSDITGGVSDGDKGDITVSGSGTVWTIDNGLDATKIADGSVSNTEFQYINSLTANAQTQIDLKQTNFHKDAVTSSAITGVTANTILISCLVPANTFAVGTVAEVRCNIQRGGGNGTATYRMYTNTSNSLSGATQLGTYNNTATQLYTPFKRLFAFKTGNVIFGAGANSTLLNDEVVSTVAPSSNTFDTTVDNWIIIAVQPANTADSFTSELFTIKGNR